MKSLVLRLRVNFAPAAMNSTTNAMMATARNELFTCPRKIPRATLARALVLSPAPAFTVRALLTADCMLANRLPPLGAKRPAQIDPARPANAPNTAFNRNTIGNSSGMRRGMNMERVIVRRAEATRRKTVVEAAKVVVMMALRKEARTETSRKMRPEMVAAAGSG